jgi:hypothetical protein
VSFCEPEKGLFIILFWLFGYDFVTGSQEKDWVFVQFEVNCQGFK